MEKHTKELERVIQEVLLHTVAKDIQALVGYQLQTGGKRLRPTLAVLSCLACGGRKQDVLYEAAALEILHNYSLIIDDIIDHSPKRRGVPTVWKKFGKSIAECVSVDYAAALLDAASTSKNPTLVAQLLARALREVVHGEILDILFEQKGREDEPYIVTHRFQRVQVKDYLDMIGKKSAVLFQVSCELGGMAAGATKKEVSSLSKYGRHLGIAFQIVDDILDFYGGKEFGKPKGQDIVERKLGNILILFALEEKRQELLRILRKKAIARKDVAAAIQLIQKTKAKEKAMKLAERHTTQAKQSLATLRPSKYRDSLEQLTDSMFQRDI